MISPRCQIADFIEAIEGKTRNEIILLADREATAAERNCLRKSADSECCQAYADYLKDFIYFIRSRSQTVCRLDPATTERVSSLKKRLRDAETLL